MTPKRVAAAIAATALVAVTLFLFIDANAKHRPGGGDPKQVSAKERTRHELIGVSAYLANKRQSGAKDAAARKSARERHRTGLRIAAATGQWRKFIYHSVVDGSSKQRTVGLQAKMAKSAEHRLSLARESAVALDLPAVAAAVSAADKGLEPIIRKLSAGKRIDKETAIRQNALMDEAIKQARAAGLSATPFVPL